MKKSMALSVALLLALPALTHAASSKAITLRGRERYRMDAGWRFHLGDLASDAARPGAAIPKWQWRAVEQNATGVPADDAGWQDAAPGQDVFRGRRGLAWFRATLPDLPGPRRTLHFESVDDDAVVYLNGVKIAEHSGWDEPFDVALDSGWRAGGPNGVAVLVRNTDGAGGVGEARVGGSAAPVTPAAARPNFDDRTWRPVHLPHDFVVEGAFDRGGNESHGFLPMGVGWYRKTFVLPASDRGRRLWLDFDGVYRNSAIWLNGRLLGREPSGYTSFRFDITAAANAGGKNVLVVRADAHAAEGWWYEGGGIYRHVWLNKAEPLHVAPWGVYVRASVDGPDVARPASAGLRVQTMLVNDGGASAACRLVSEVVAPDGRVVARAAGARGVPARGTVEVGQTLRLARPLLWSIESPRMYRLVTRLERNGVPFDRVTTPFGVRTVHFDPDRGLFLNGRAVKLQGTCNHQDHAGVGVALPDRLIEARIRALKAMGSNAYRCSHNPPADELLDACDRLGMLVLEETRHLGDTYRPKTAPGTPASDLSDLRRMVLRDRNHPSIFAWSLSNEEPLQGSEEGARIYSAMKAVVNRLDPSRPVTAAMNGGWGGGFTRVQDLQGCNYNPGGYDGFHRRFPNMPVFGSETMSAVSTRGIYENDPRRGYVSAYDVNHPPWGQTAEVGWRALAERPFMAGGFVWTGFDYRGEPTPYSWPCINSHFGIMDTCGFPKDTYYYYRAWWGAGTTLHLLPHWNWPGREGQEIDVWAHSNCDAVELFLNGKSLGRKEMPRNGHLEWKVAYAPGRLEARGYKGGKSVITDGVATTGAPAALRLRPERAAPFTADGEDVIPVAVEVVDAGGRIVPTASDTVTFAVTGPGHVAGVGNGDPSSHEPDKARVRRAFNGRCLAIVQAGERPGTVVLTATAPGLRPARAVLTTRPPGPGDPKEWR